MSLNVKEAMRKWGPEYLAICGLAKYFPTMNSESHVFFVNADNGNDGVNTLGQRPDDPLLTITKAISLCTTKTNDYIFVLRYYQATGEVWPIVLDKEYLHIIGISGGFGIRGGCPGPWVQPVGDNAAFSMDYDSAHCEIAGFQLAGGTNHGCIDIDRAGGWGFHFHNNYFALKQSLTGMYGINVANTGSGEMIQSLIENNIFGAGLTEAGIVIPSGAGASSCHGLIIRNNHFTVNTGDHGVDVLQAGADFQEGGIFNNTFEVDGDATDGEAVYFVSGAKGSVHGNYAWTDNGVVPTSNPFFDAGSTGMSFGMNIRGAGEVATDTLRGTGAISLPTNTPT